MLSHAGAASPGSSLKLPPLSSAAHRRPGPSGLRERSVKGAASKQAPSQHVHRQKNQPTDHYYAWARQDQLRALERAASGVVLPAAGAVRHSEDGNDWAKQDQATELRNQALRTYLATTAGWGTTVLACTSKEQFVSLITKGFRTYVASRASSS